LDKRPPDGQSTLVHSGYLNDARYYNDSPMAKQQASQFVTHYVNSDDDWYMYQQCTSEYYNTNTSQLQKDYYTKLGSLSVLDIYFFMLQIAKGMEHIGKMKASNCDCVYCLLAFVNNFGINLKGKLLMRG